ncbi:MAG: putative lipid II flippase FtsW [Candidatus Omnitrophota bacterium]
MSRAAQLYFTCIYSLVGIGIVMTYSASAVYADQIYDSSFYFLIRQAIFTLVGTFFLYGAAAIPPFFWKKNARALILISMAMMLLVFVPGLGREAGGAKRWIHLGPVNFQPVEFAKIAVCIYLADYLSRKIKVIQRGQILVFFPPLLLIGLICCLSLLQPDLGSCAFLALLTGLLYFLVGVHLRYVLIAVGMFVPILYFLVIKVPYRMSRITAYLNPWEDPQGSGFQMIQSLLAFGLGAWKGVGLGLSTQKLFYLPSAYNDFVFSILGEELGFVGIFFVWAMFVTILICGIMMARRTSDNFNKLLILSVTFLFVFQAILNMMVATGLLPTKGLPLPFIGYGGTSIVVNLMAVGIVLGVDMQSNRG